MKKELLLGLSIVFMGCQPDKDITPDHAALSAEVKGNYQTNSFLDFRCIALSADQLPKADVKAQSDSQITIVLHQYYPDKQDVSLQNVLLSRQTDNSIQLMHNGEAIGTFQQDRIFTSSGMETTGNVLRVNKAGSAPMVFVGYK